MSLRTSCALCARRMIVELSRVRQVLLLQSPATADGWMCHASAKSYILHDGCASVEDMCLSVLRENSHASDNQLKRTQNELPL